MPNQNPESQPEPATVAEMPISIEPDVGFIRRIIGRNIWMRRVEHEEFVSDSIFSGLA